MRRFLAAAGLTTLVLLLATVDDERPLHVASTNAAGPALEDGLAPRAPCAEPPCGSSPSSAELTGQRDAVSAKPPSRTPAPIANKGYRVVFVDAFKRLRRGVWDNREWWNTPPPRRSQYVRDGVLHLVSRRSQGYPSHIAMTTFSSQKVFKHGFFEARMRWTKGNGSWPGFWLLSNRWARKGADDCSSAAAEIDVFEGYGSHPRVFTGTIHRNSADWLCPPENRINSNNWQPGRVDLTRRFHTYAIRWTPARVTWFLDGRKVMSSRVFRTTDTRMFLVLSMYTGGESSPDSSSPAELHTEVDWVRVWQR